MAQQISYSTTVRSNRMTQVLNAIDAQATSGKIAIYDGTRPNNGGTATTKLWELSLGTVSATKPSGTVTNGVLSILTNGSTGAAAVATGTATWARLTDASGTFVADMNVGTSGADINLNTTSITSGQTVYITSGGTITDGNNYP